MWVEASCRAQGVPSRAADPAVVTRVETLLRGGRGRGGARQAKRGRRPARRRASGSPDGIDAVVVEPVGLPLGGVDDDVLDDSGDDGCLAG